MTGNFGGTVGVEMATEKFKERLERAVELTLSEFANGFTKRKSVWLNTHDEFEKMIGNIFADIGEELAQSMWRGENDLNPEYLRRLDLSLSQSKVEVQAHKIGWTAPKAEKWHELHPLWFTTLTSTISAVSGFLLGRI
ncbi:hypothetical protein GCM10023115_19230 [Pontixanthobacter gangjinensis]